MYVYSNFVFPEGRSKALTMSYDDGVEEDRRLVEIFNQYGLKGTFHLNSGRQGVSTLADARVLYQGHEVSCHSKNHPTLERIPNVCILNQMLEDRLALERLVGYPVRGMSYPNGGYNSEILPILTSAGIVYSRTTLSTGKYSLPDNWLVWHPTCHHNDDLLARGEHFKQLHSLFSVFYIWGHSYEFARQNNWALIENFCQSMANLPNVWYASNIEIYDYVMAARRLEFSADGSLVHNPSALAVWLKLSANGEIKEISAGQIVSLA